MKQSTTDDLEYANEGSWLYNWIMDFKLAIVAIIVISNSIVADVI